MTTIAADGKRCGVVEGRQGAPIEGGAGWEGARELIGANSRNDVRPRMSDSGGRGNERSLRGLATRREEVGGQHAVRRGRMATGPTKNEFAAQLRGACGVRGNQCSGH